MATEAALNPPNTPVPEWWRTTSPAHRRGLAHTVEGDLARTRLAACRDSVLRAAAHAGRALDLADDARDDDALLAAAQALLTLRSITRDARDIVALALLEGPDHHVDTTAKARACGLNPDAKARRAACDRAHLLLGLTPGEGHDAATGDLISWGAL